MRNLKSIMVGLMISALSTVAFADGHWSTIKIGTEVLMNHGTLQTQTET